MSILTVEIVPPLLVVVFVLHFLPPDGRATVDDSEAPPAVAFPSHL